MRTLHESLLSRLVIDPSGCLLWSGHLDRNGYGLMYAMGRTRLVHRVAYEVMQGPIPDGLTLDHLCRVRHCANVLHLEPVAQRVNTLRGQTVNAANAAKTHCDAGHEFDLLNTYVRPRGGRDCRICTRERGRRYLARKRLRPERRAS